MTPQLTLIAPTRTYTRVGKMTTNHVLFPGQVYAGRGPGRRDMNSTPIGIVGWLGNPFDIQTHGSRALPKFEDVFGRRLDDLPVFRDAIRDLHGKELLCWCVTKWNTAMTGKVRCHAQIIARAADRLTNE